MSLVVKRVKEGFFFDRVLFEATEYEEAVFGCMLGDKLFWVDKGDRLSLLRSKKEMWEAGDQVSCLSDLITSHNQGEFAWCWV